MVTKLNSLYLLLQGSGNIIRKEVKKNVRNKLEKEARITKGMSCRHDIAIGLMKSLEMWLTAQDMLSTQCLNTFSQMGRS